jgi:hypothetical protein
MAFLRLVKFTNISIVILYQLLLQPEKTMLYVIEDLYCTRLTTSKVFSNNPFLLGSNSNKCSINPPKKAPNQTN